MHDTLPASVEVVSQPGPLGTEAWASCACGWRGRNHTRRAEAEAEGAAHRCPVSTPTPLDNQGRPVHGDKVGYHAARAEMLGGGA